VKEAHVDGPLTLDRRVPVGWLIDTISRILAAAGLSSAAAGTVATSLVDADLRGTSSHGTLLVPMYVERLRRGSVSTAEQAAVAVDLGAIAVLDARNCLGQFSGDQAMAMAVDKAREYGVGVVSVRHAFHFGSAARYVQEAAAAGCIGIAAANTRPLMPAPGGAAAVVGNNPLAIGVPRAGAPPIVLDMALSEASLGKIRLAEREARTIPTTWAVDRDGKPTDDPARALAGMLQPAAGHKGYGLALMIDILTGVLSGGGFGSHVRGLYSDTTVPNDCAHLFLALDVSAFGDPDEFAARLSDLVAQITDAPRAPGNPRVLLPGQIESERAATATAVALGGPVFDALSATADELGVTLSDPDEDHR
jgi:LDH2 family malate/lactate/ureidoglycolate dehydrogenase